MFQKLYYRLHQNVLKVGSKFVKWRKPALVEGSGCVRTLSALIKKEKIGNMIIITDQGIMSLGLLNDLEKTLKEDNISYVIFDGAMQNPTTHAVEEAFEMYQKNKCEGVIAFGGGSAIDCAKALGARVAHPSKSLLEMKGLLKVRKKIPPLFAIPTTAGTGSEATIAAVITDDQTHMKYQINDMALIPHTAILDPMLTVSLPAHITAATGMDALTHAIEAYIGKSNTKETRAYSKKAVALIFENLKISYFDGENIIARANMLRASHFAGIAFTRAYIGYIHAMAHALGGLYNIPHGLANSIILPHVLEYYGSSIHRQLAELADLLKIGNSTDSQKEKAKKFIDAIKDLNMAMQLPNKISEIQTKDIPLLVELVLKEANPFYPVPKILFKKDIEVLFNTISQQIYMEEQ